TYWRLDAVDMIDRSDTAVPMEFLIRALNDTDSDVSHAALRAIEKRSDPSTLDALIAEGAVSSASEWNVDKALVSTLNAHPEMVAPAVEKLVKKISARYGPVSLFLASQCLPWEVDLGYVAVSKRVELAEVAGGLSGKCGDQIRQKLLEDPSIHVRVA